MKKRVGSLKVMMSNILLALIIPTVIQKDVENTNKWEIL